VPEGERLQPAPGRIRLLIVDDHPVVRDGLRGILEGSPDFEVVGVEARVLVLTTYDTDADVVPAIEAGATGYLLKDAPRGDLLRAVRAAAHGEAVLSPSVATRLLGQVRGQVRGQGRAPGPEPLSARELDVLALIARGCSNRDAAVRLFISEATVKTHLLHIYAKLGVNDRAAAVAAGFERGLLPRAVD
jgi:DNA-binding NarL/FixJ family response regulator